MWFEKHRDHELYSSTGGERPDPFHVFQPPKDAGTERSTLRGKSAAKERKERKKKELYMEIGVEAASELEMHQVGHVTDSMLKPLNICRPQNAEQLPLVDPETGADMGSVVISIALLPAKVADHEEHRVGAGRREPNRFPTLGSPVGRFSMAELLNPLYCISRCGSNSRP